ncbi:transcription elongation factor GreA [Paucilactobacillus oligofermentans DSM 15707 = LMG 22743]|uniref:Transcription elongation factor GreA n=1 Tax=Paucilactobacillus oligofermentans DSM 15707 = LMG 22743 TaxID=1423778 RepID=A0A0R1RER0_9LACO|nr:transcription elongation factor GreA [Paucilactobacillus oligofermentans]KRL55517.1 transcription elongation factor GreA [Paucilactobacillus oligofermentans DSM 15707 = LMG 22743]CUS25495.1 Transcription elongation factor greA 1 [Paucilactobacillus oligofermentans DSM 15707 = LMG 22743]
MEPYFNKMTPTGYAEIEAEIEQLKLVRPEKIQILAAARALGDLSENAEYSSAKRDLRRLEGRLRFLNKQLQYAQVVTPSNNDLVEIGKTITVEFLDDHETDTYLVVGKQEANITAGKMSFNSPLGSAVINHQVGDTVSITSPDSEYTVKIIAVTF